MRILHILDHSLPLHSGYTFRTLSILKEQGALGWETFHLTGPKQGNCRVLEEDIDGWHFYRTPPAIGLTSKLPVLNQTAVINRLIHRLNEVAEVVKPDILHAHSPGKMLRWTMAPAANGVFDIALPEDWRVTHCGMSTLSLPFAKGCGATSSRGVSRRKKSLSYPMP